MPDDCAELHASADDLHLAAATCMEKAAFKRLAGERFVEEVSTAARYERLADAVEARIAEDC